MHAAFVLGWEGNARAAIPLIELLYDSDIRVQQTVVNALSNLRDDRILTYKD
ncbi:MAG: HEAT repeat domain-containing protein [Deltaproteobacteria bacterium]|nr:HEAT repeat domain-containing protein [Deltaproteobacteria bacterium]MBW1794308.1 HEAT repeat domain-containing protein [Deltaproteobacteria bacterium]